MSYEIDSVEFRAGDPLLASRLQALLDELRRPSAVIRGGGAVTVRQGARGQAEVAGDRKLAFVGVAAGNIAARSGSTWGTGSVVRYAYSPSAGTGASISVTYAVVNPSSNTMADGHGIDSGQYCWVQEDDDGNLVVTPLECS